MQVFLDVEVSASLLITQRYNSYFTTKLVNLTIYAVIFVAVCMYNITVKPDHDIISRATMLSIVTQGWCLIGSLLGVTCALK